MIGVFTAAWDAYNNGLCVVPPRQDGTKAPLGDEHGLWKDYQTTRPTPAQMQRWYTPTGRRTGVGLITGAISGNLEPIDIDEREVWPAFQERMHAAGLGPLLGRITQGYSERSPNGFHLVYRCSTIAGNTVLAQRPGDNGGIKTLIETRGEGGYLIVAPSNGKVHPSGAAYEVLAGSFATIATITPEERTMLWAVAQSLDQMPVPEVPTLPVSADTLRTQGTRPGDDFNARARWSDVLEPHGWTLMGLHGNTGLWRRPGKDIGLSATTNHLGYDRLYVFSTSTEMEAQHWYDKFQAITMLDYHGDFSAAATVLSAKGYGQRSNGTSANGTTPAQQNGSAAPQTLEQAATALDEMLARGRFIDWSTFWDGDSNAEEWLAEPVLPAARQVAIYSPAKVGKSLLALDIAARLALGNVRIFDQRPGPPVPGVYIDQEMTEDDVRERLEDMGYGPESDLTNLHYSVLGNFPSLDTVEGGELLLAFCLHFKAQFCFIDTTSRVLAGKENDADTMRAFYMYTGLLLKGHGIALVRLDHAGKDPERGMRGTSAKNDDVDLVWALNERDGGGIRLKATHRRQAWVPEIVDLIRVEDPYLRHERALESWPTGTVELALTMDRMGIPLNYGGRKVRAELRTNGISAANGLVAATLRYRKSRKISE